jgi:type IV pilus modification protein PilV
MHRKSVQKHGQFKASIRSQTGVSLLEMMIALLVFVIGLLALALLGIKGMSYTRDSAMRSQAIYAARSLAEAIKANPGVNYAFSGSAQAFAPANCPYTLTANVSAIAANGNCACRVRENDLARTLEAVKNLPAGALPKLQVVRLDVDKPGFIEPSILAPSACVGYLGATYEVRLNWAEGGGAAFSAENPQTVAVLSML